MEAIKKAEVGEIKLLYHEELDVLEPVMEEELGDNKAHGSHLFTVEKFLANGEHDKCKLRLVLHGNEQDPLLFPNKSSPTVAIHSILSCLTVAAYNGVQEAAKIDLKGAFIQTPMEGPPVYMRCDKNLTKLIVEVYPQFKKYVSKDGYLYNRWKKALYGCIQAISFWFKKLVKFLVTEGYEQSPTDPCVMRRIVNDKICLLLIYVDDILILADRAEIERLKVNFTKEFTWITMDVGKVHSYLGMQIEFEDGFVKVDMKHFIEKMLGEVDNLQEHPTPADKNVFTVEESEKLSETDRKKFHTLVAKLLFLSKRARPDFSLANGFLCTRFSRAMKEDRRKLYRLLGFLKRTKDEVFILRPSDLELLAFIDAAFASHPDSKSHTGIAIFIGGVLVFAASRKQKCVTKSPTESELVALTDNIGFVELFAEFFGFTTITEVKSPMIYQDFTSVISLVTKGGGVVRTKHLRVRMNLCKEAYDEERIRIGYANTNDMKADGLTKPLQGEQFQKLKTFMLGTSTD